MSYTAMERRVVRLGVNAHPLWSLFLALGSAFFLWRGAAVDSKLLFGFGCVWLMVAIANLERRVWYRIICKADPHLAHRVAEYERTGLDI